MATYQTYQEIGLKEDISDIITNISPRKTPFSSSIGTEKVTQPLFQWQEDSLRAVAGTAGAAVEGADPADATIVPTVMRNNQTQIFVEAPKVSETAQASLAYGRAKELAYQLSKSAAQLKRDFENACVGTAQALAAGNSSTARNMAGVQVQVAAGNINYMGAATNLSEAGLLIGLQNAFTAGADPSRIHVTPSNSLIVAAFASAAGRYRTIQDTGSSKTTLVNAVNLYVSPFGEQVVEVNRFMKAKNTLIFEPDQWSIAVLRPWTRETLAKTGDAFKQMIVGEFSLKHKNFSASAMTIDNATTGF